jgi:hypothetical protein
MGVDTLAVLLYEDVELHGREMETSSKKAKTNGDFSHLHGDTILCARIFILGTLTAGWEAFYCEEDATSERRTAVVDCLVIMFGGTEKEVRAVRDSEDTQRGIGEKHPVMAIRHRRDTKSKTTRSGVQQ